MRLWRLARAARADRAFSGEGAQLVGSRWTHPGHPAIYTSESIALTVLEALVHLELNQAPRFVVISADIPDDLPITSILIDELPDNWFQTPAPDAIKRLGTVWLEEGETAILKVPSSIVHDESNYIINPKHDQFSKIKVGIPQPFNFDGRLWAKRRV